MEPKPGIHGLGGSNSLHPRRNHLKTCLPFGESQRGKASIMHSHLQLLNRMPLNVIVTLKSYVLFYANCWVIRYSMEMSLIIKILLEL